MEEGPQLLLGSPRLFKQGRRIVIHCDRPVALRGSNTHMQTNTHTRKHTFQLGDGVCVCVFGGVGGVSSNPTC